MKTTPTNVKPDEDEPVLVLNDQGGGQMDVTYDATQTLRAQTHGHPPLILIDTQ